MPAILFPPHLSVFSFYFSFLPPISTTTYKHTCVPASHPFHAQKQKVIGCCHGTAATPGHQKLFPASDWVCRGVWAIWVMEHLEGGMEGKGLAMKAMFSWLSFSTTFLKSIRSRLQPALHPSCPTPGAFALHKTRELQGHKPGDGHNATSVTAVPACMLKSADIPFFWCAFKDCASTHTTPQSISSVLPFAWMAGRMSPTSSHSLPLNSVECMHNNQITPLIILHEHAKGSH